MTKTPNQIISNATKCKQNQIRMIPYDTKPMINNAKETKEAWKLLKKSQLCRIAIDNDGNSNYLL